MLNHATLKFKHQALKELYQYLFNHPRQEAYAVLLGERLDVDNTTFINVHHIRYPSSKDYLLKSSYQVKVHRSFLADCLEEIDRSSFLNTIIEVHNHPFAKSIPNFSTIDLNHERELFDRLQHTEPTIHYGSLLLGPRGYRGHLYINTTDQSPTTKPLTIHTQTWKELKDLFPNEKKNRDHHVLFPSEEALKTRVTLIASGLTLPLMTSILQNIGIHGLHTIEVTQDKLKVYSLHEGIEVETMDLPISEHHPIINRLIAHSDWVLLYSNDEALNQTVQRLALKYFVPFIIGTSYASYKDLSLAAWKGQVITAHMGDGICYMCGVMSWMEPSPIPSPVKNNHHRRHILPNPYERPQLPIDVMVANLCLDQLIRELQGMKTEHLLIIENEETPFVYPDSERLYDQATVCSYCHRNR